ncbi:hypothetical protein BH24ACT15_BH24ACT15_24730 [soil metagenome]
MAAIAAGVTLVAGCSGPGLVTNDPAVTTVRDPIAVLPSGNTAAPARATDPDDRSTVAEEQDPLAPIPTVTPSGQEASESVVTGTPAQLCTSLGIEWCDDADGNGVPDTVEATLGYDPSGDDCQPEGCAEPAQIAAALNIARAPVLIAVDGASAMAEAFGDSTRIDAARQAVERLTIGTPDFVPLGLISFGDRGDPLQSGRTESCSAITTHAFPGDLAPDNATDIAGAALAVGWRPVTEIIKSAAPILASAGQVSDSSAGAQPGRMILLTSGADTCGEDPVTVVEELVGNQTAPIIDVIGLNVTQDDGAVLGDVAARSGGSYTSVSDPQGLFQAVDALSVRPVEALRPALCPPAADEQPTACRGQFRDSVAAELASQAEQVRQEGDDVTAGLIEAFAIAVADDLLSVPDGPLLNSDVEEAIGQAQETRHRFEQRYKMSLPGDDLAGCMNPSLISA